MANQALFSSKKNTKTKNMQNKLNSLTTNQAGGKAYQLSDEHALAQFACTGCFNDTFYSSADDQFNKALELANNVSLSYLAKTAIYARQEGFMKDMPAFLLAILANRVKHEVEEGFNENHVQHTFYKVVDNGKMLKNFVQIVRSGKTGRKSFGSFFKRLMQNWLNNRKDEQLLTDTIGNNPSLADVIKMVHPNPKNKSREAFFAYIIDKKFNKKNLPKVVKDYIDFCKADESERKNMDVPEVNHQLLTHMPLTNKQWKQIAQNANWHSVRMNLNTFERHGVLKDSSVVKILADKLSDRETIKKVKVFPYQLMTAYLNIEANIPTELKNALQDAIEVACENVPVIDGQIYVFPDVSGSMSSGSVTGNRGSATSVVRPIDVAALISSIFLRQNKKTSVMPFDTRVHSTSALNSRDSIMTNAAKLRKFGGGGTSCEIVLQQLNQQKAKGDLLIYVSDNESWFGNRGYRHENTGVTQEWEVFKKRNPKAKMVCIDLVSNDTTQILDDKDVMNVGGFSDAVFEAIENFVNGKGKNKDWVSLIKATPLEKEE